MEQNATLYDMVYRDIVTDIYMGTLKHGDKFPTLMQICQKYNIGRNTARAVVQLLAENGFLEQGSRKQAVVCFDFNHPETRRRYLTEIAGRRESLHDVFYGIALLISDAAVFCIDSCTEGERLGLADLCGTAVEWEIKTELELFQRLFSIYRYALSLARNNLLLSLFQAMYRFILIPFSTVDRTSPAFRMMLPVIRVLLRSFRRYILDKNYGALKKQLVFFCSSSGKRSDDYIARICGGIEEAPASRFSWIPGRSQEFLYIAIIGDIMLKIRSGSYLPGEPLPSYAELAAQYNVSEKTSRRAVSILNRLQLVQTSNGRHTRVLDFPVRRPMEFIRDPFVQHQLTSCIEGIQLMTMIAPAVAEEALRLSYGACREAFIKKIAQKSYLPLESLMDPFLEVIPSPCVQNVFRQLCRVISWGGLLEFCTERKRPFINREIQNSHARLSTETNASLPGELRRLYTRAFQIITALAGELGFQSQMTVRALPPVSGGERH